MGLRKAPPSGIGGAHRGIAQSPSAPLPVPSSSLGQRPPRHPQWRLEKSAAPSSSSSPPPRPSPPPSPSARSTSAARPQVHAFPSSLISPPPLSLSLVRSNAALSAAHVIRLVPRRSLVPPALLLLQRACRSGSRRRCPGSSASSTARPPRRPTCTGRGWRCGPGWSRRRCRWPCGRAWWCPWCWWWRPCTTASSASPSRSSGGGPSGGSSGSPSTATTRRRAARTTPWCWCRYPCIMSWRWEGTRPAQKKKVAENWKIISHSSIDYSANRSTSCCFVRLNNYLDVLRFLCVWDGRVGVQAVNSGRMWAAVAEGQDNSPSAGWFHRSVHQGNLHLPFLFPRLMQGWGLFLWNLLFGRSWNLAPFRSYQNKRGINLLLSRKDDKSFDMRLTAIPSQEHAN